MLEINNLSVNFHTDSGVVHALDGVNLNIGKEETLAVLGESGCGKSVTALAIMRLIQTPPGDISSGEILFDGINLFSLSEAEMCKVRGNKMSMIFQEPMTSLNPVLRVGNQIAESFRLHQGKNEKEALENALKMLELVGIPDPEMRIKNYPHQMSGGMRQRVMIAMALSCNPQLLIADEPTTALDVTIQAQILSLMNELKRKTGTSIMLITHDMGVVAETAQHVVVMYAGRVVEQADVHSLFKNPQHPYTIGLMESMPSITHLTQKNKRLKAIPGTVPNLLDLGEGCPFRNRCQKSDQMCSQELPELRDLGQNHKVRCFHV